MGEHFTAIDAFLWPGRWAIGGLLRPARVYMYTVLITSSAVLAPSAGFEVLYWPAGVRSKLPSGANVNRRKKEV